MVLIIIVTIESPCMYVLGNMTFQKRPVVVLKKFSSYYLAPPSGVLVTAID